MSGARRMACADARTAGIGLARQRQRVGRVPGLGGRPAQGRAAIPLPGEGRARQADEPPCQGHAPRGPRGHPLAAGARRLAAARHRRRRAAAAGRRRLVLGADLLVSSSALPAAALTETEPIYGSRYAVAPLPQTTLTALGAKRTRSRWWLRARRPTPCRRRRCRRATRTCPPTTGWCGTARTRPRWARSRSTLSRRRWRPPRTRRRPRAPGAVAAGRAAPAGSAAAPRLRQRRRGRRGRCCCWAAAASRLPSRASRRCWMRRRGRRRGRGLAAPPPPASKTRRPRPRRLRQRL